MKEPKEIFAQYKRKLLKELIEEINGVLSIKIPEKLIKVAQDSVSVEDVEGYIDVNIKQQQYLLDMANDYKKNKNLDIYTDKGDINPDLPNEDHGTVLWETYPVMQNPIENYVNDLANKIINLHWREKDLLLDTIDSIKQFVENDTNLASHKTLSLLGKLSRVDNDIANDRKRPRVVIDPVAWMEYIKQECDNNMVTEATRKEYVSIQHQYAAQFDKFIEQGLDAAAEKASKEITILNKKSLAVLHGCNKFFTQEIIDTFVDKVQSGKIDMKHPTNNRARVAYFKKYEEFPRIVPDTIFEKKQILSDQKIFDEFYILYLDYTNEELQTVNSKLTAKQKDPILFGKIDKDSKELYFIADWIDDVCDLTLQKLSEKMAKEPNFAIEYAGSPKNIEKTISQAIKKYQSDSKDLSNARDRNSATAVLNNRNKKPSLFQRIANIFS